jgi:hypothetical protein
MIGHGTIHVNSNRRRWPPSARCPRTKATSGRPNSQRKRVDHYLHTIFPGSWTILGTIDVVEWCYAPRVATFRGRKGFKLRLRPLGGKLPTQMIETLKLARGLQKAGMTAEQSESVAEFSALFFVQRTRFFISVSSSRGRPCSDQRSRRLSV